MAQDKYAVAAVLAAHAKGRTEADIQSDVRQFLLCADLGLTPTEVALEPQVGGKGRIDVEMGNCIIEVKKDLMAGNTKAQAAQQLAGYVNSRIAQFGHRYLGVLTDGRLWVLYRPADGELHETGTLTLTGSDDDADRLEAWFQALMSTNREVPPTPHEVHARLGAGSPAFRVDYLDILGMYEMVKDLPEVQLKRQLWAKLLTTALGTQFQDSDTLFAEHTYLVVVAELVAHAVVGFPLEDPSLTPEALVSGDKFREVGIFGVVESDFFDWLLHAPGGGGFITDLARRIAHFDWHEVRHDVLRLLYESVIDTETRHQLGEYYTPDWLADSVVRHVVPNPIDTRVLDPSCGSGTFVYHAVKNYVAAAEKRGLGDAAILTGATRRVFGMDLHPVAVSLARTTYLLALGKRRLTTRDRPPLTVPVFLGDSLQWSQQQGILGSQGLTVPTGEGGLLFGDLTFPDRLLDDAARFDQLITRLSDLATARRKGSPVPSLSGVFSHFAVHPDDQAQLADTFALMCQLYDSGRDHIWGYYIRNLARPLWLTRPENRVNALVGNPPWLAYRFMPPEMQQRFKQETQERHMWAGAKVATHQDLSAYFVARAAELYLEPGGRFGFVMPFAVLSRIAYEGFRTGDLHTANEGTRLTFAEPWDLHKVKPDPFPVPCSVIFGQHTPQKSMHMPTEVLQWSGRLPAAAIGWDEAKGYLTQALGSVQVASTDGERSVYAKRFRQGANLVPRMLLFVRLTKTNPLGAGHGKTEVTSLRTPQEKQPWKALPDLSDVVESQFVRKVHLGSTVAPYRCLTPWRAVIPLVRGDLLDNTGDPAPISRYPGLAAWWHKAEKIWSTYRSATTRLSLLEQVDYHGKLTAQVPAATHRVVYSASGTTIAAAVLEDPQVLVEHSLYSASAASLSEARYLCAILNSQALLDRVKGLQSRGQFGARHFDSYVFAVPFPLFDPTNQLHQDLAQAAQTAEEVAATVPLGEDTQFQRARKLIRQALAADGVGARIEDLVQQLIAPPAADEWGEIPT